MIKTDISLLTYAHTGGTCLLMFPSVKITPTCVFTPKVSGEVFLPHSAGLLAPRSAGALLPESTQGQLGEALGTGGVLDCLDKLCL